MKSKAASAIRAYALSRADPGMEAQKQGHREYPAALPHLGMTVKCVGRTVLSRIHKGVAGVKRTIPVFAVVRFPTASCSVLGPSAGRFPSASCLRPLSFLC